MSFENFEQSSSLIFLNCPIYSPKPIRRTCISNKYSQPIFQLYNKKISFQTSQKLQISLNFCWDFSSCSNNSLFGTNSNYSDYSDDQDKIDCKKELMEIISNKINQPQPFVFDEVDDCSEIIKIERPKNPFYKNIE